MADATRSCGTEEGLGERLAMWANSLGRNREFPWAGLGLIDDIKCAARLLGVDPDALYPADVYTRATAPRPPQKNQEYDL